MITHGQFHLIRLRAAIFFSSHVAIPSMKVLKDFAVNHEDKFDGSPFILPDQMSQTVPPEIPRITLNNVIGKWMFQVASSRADVFRTQASEIDVLSAPMLYGECAPLLDSFVTTFNLDISRLAAVFERYCLHDTPGAAISNFFCKHDLTSQEGPLNRPEGFELHAHKVYEVSSGLRVNSWVKCRSGMVAGEINGPAILIEQDINTLPPEGERVYLQEERSNFFRMVSEEMDKIMELYFPDKKGE